MRGIIESIHRIAQLRHPWHELRVIVAPNPPYTSAPVEPGDPPRFTWLARVESLTTTVEITGIGPTPDAALQSLHTGLLDYHRAVDVCRAAAVRNAETVSSLHS